MKMEESLERIALALERIVEMRAGEMGKEYETQKEGLARRGFEIMPGATLPDLRKL